MSAATRIRNECGTPAPVRICAIIPLYNGAAYIREALLSVVAQTLPPEKIIVVDDGSTDDGPRIVERLALEHPIQLLRKANGGQGSARNFGVAHSDCDLIAFLDQDDLWYPHHLERLVKPFLRPRPIELGWVYSDLDEVDAAGRLVVRSVLQQLSTQHPKRTLHGCLSADMFVLPSASLVSRRAFDAIGGFDERLRGYEDDDLFLRMFRSGYDNIYLNQALSQWRMSDNSASYRPSMAISRAIYFRKLIAEFPNEPKRGRYWTKHALIPRFLPTFVAEATQAARRRDWPRLKVSLEDVRYASQFHSRRLRITVDLLTLLLRARWLVISLLALRPAFRPIVRWAFRAL